MNDSSSDAVSPNVDGGAEAIPTTSETSETSNNKNKDNVTLQEPVDRHNETDVVSRQPDSSQHDHHGDQTGFRNARCSDGGCCSGYAAEDMLACDSDVRGSTERVKSNLMMMIWPASRL